MNRIDWIGSWTTLDVASYFDQFRLLSDNGDDFSYVSWLESKDFVLQIVVDCPKQGEIDGTVARDDLTIGILEWPDSDNLC